MAKWMPCKRRDFIKKLRKLGFEPPEPGGRHHYMRYGRYTLTLPSNKEYSVPQIKMLLNEIERGIIVSDLNKQAFNGLSLRALRSSG